MCLRLVPKSQAPERCEANGIHLHYDNIIENIARFVSLVLVAERVGARISKKSEGAHDRTTLFGSFRLVKTSKTGILKAV